MHKTLEIINEVFAKILNRPGIKLEMSDSPKSVHGWDSLTHPELITALEESLGIEFNFKELAGITNINDLVFHIENKLNSGGK